MPVPFRNDVLMKKGERVGVIANDPGGLLDRPTPLSMRAISSFANPV
jgi:hypothetical protein